MLCSCRDRRLFAVSYELPVRGVVKRLEVLQLRSADLLIPRILSSPAPQGLWQLAFSAQLKRGHGGPALAARCCRRTPSAQPALLLTGPAGALLVGPAHNAELSISMATRCDCQLGACTALQTMSL